MRTIGVFVVALLFLAASPAAQTIIVTDASPPEAKLAALDAHSKTVQRAMNQSLLMTAAIHARKSTD